MKYLICFTVLASTLMHAGNSTFDTSSFTTIEYSASKMVQTLSADDAYQFKKDIKEIQQMYVSQSQNDKEALDALSKALSNKTAKEFLIYYDSITIKGGFGISLDSPIDKTIINKTIPVEGHTIINIVSPPKPLKFFDSYFVMTTPKTHKVYNISARKTYENSAICDNLLSRLSKILERKYGKMLPLSYSYKGFISRIVRGNNVQIQCQGTRSNTLILSYGSSSMEEVAKEEAAEIMASEMDTSSL